MKSLFFSFLVIASSTNVIEAKNNEEQTIKNEINNHPELTQIVHNFLDKKISVDEFVKQIKVVANKYNLIKVKQIATELEQNLKSIPVWIKQLQDFKVHVLPLLDTKAQARLKELEKQPATLMGLILGF